MNRFRKYMQFCELLWTCMVLLIIMSGCATCKNYNMDRWFGKDKFYHFTAAGVIGAGTTLVASNNSDSESVSHITGISVAVGIGAGKECYDTTIKETYWSWKDMFWNLIGGVAGSYAVTN